MSFGWVRGSHPGQRPGADLAPSEFRRLGKPGAYRLGQLRAQGVSLHRPPTPFRARFARRRDHRWPAPVWLLSLLAGTVAIAAATAFGWSFVPLLVGFGAGIANRNRTWPPRVALPAVAVMAAAGWILPFLLRHLPSVAGAAGGALARAASALTGLPRDAAGVAGLTALIAVVLALAGYWVATVLTPRMPDDQLR